MPDGTASLSATDLLRQPVTAEHDGWKIESASAQPVTPAELVQRMGGPEAPAVVEPPKVETPPAAESDEPVVADKPAAAVVAAPAVADPAAPPAKPKKADPQARINEATRLRHAAERETAAATARAEAVQRELEAERAKNAPPPVVAKPAVELVEPKEDDFETYGAFQTALRAYDRAVITAEADARIARTLDERDAKAREASSADRLARAHAQRVAAFNDRLDAARTEHADLDAIIDTPIPLSAPMKDIIVDSEVGPQMWIYLHGHPEECERIARLHPLIAIREMGGIEREIKLQRAAHSGPAAVAPPISRARPPLKPGAGSVPTASASETRVDTIATPFGPEWIRAENRREQARRARRL